MSTTVDHRVVEMQFDNKQFERGVSTTMSSLDKLKQKLHLPGATKGLEDVGRAAKKVDLSCVSNSADTVGLRFSAMYTIADQALRNITNSAMAAGKKIISALTLDPVKSGFQEYETQMNSVQTILANTQSKGSTLEDVNEALEQLNKYADQTIYNFTEMTRNIGTFTAAGVDLETSVSSIKGIANLAAVSGSTSQQASTAMYQLSQALAAGKVSLMDWNSVVNAGMGGELFQNALLRTSELLKTGGQEAVNMYGSFRESLTKGEWLTKEVLTETLKQISGAYSESELMAKGYSQQQAKDIVSLAKTATDAATKVKTFTQLWDVMKEAAQSGWAQTWKIIVGDFEEAKALLTPLADFFTNIIGKISDARNELLESALGKNFLGLFSGLTDSLGGLSKSIGVITETTSAIGDLGEVVDNVILGKFGNGKDRYDALTEAGYNYYRVQNKVNETLGNSFRHTEEQIAAQDELLGTQSEIIKQADEQVSASKKLNKQQIATILLIGNLTDAEAEAMGYTKEQIAAVRDLTKHAEKLGMTLPEFINNLDQINGRWLLINSFKNVGQAIVEVFRAMGKAWRDIFDPITDVQIFNIIAGLHRLTTYLEVNREAADKFRRTFRGVFAALDLVLMVVGGPIKIAFKALTQLLGMFDLNILDATALIGDAIVKFHDWVESILDFTKIFEAIMPVMSTAANAIVDWVKSVELFDNIGVYFREAADAILEWFNSLKESENLPADIISGLINGLKKGISTVGQAALSLAQSIWTSFCSFLGIASPSKKMEEAGGYIVDGVVSGVTNAGPKVLDGIKTLCKGIIETAKNFDWSMISGSLWVVSAFLPSAPILNILAAIANFAALAGTTFLDKFKDVLGIHSPSKAFFDVGSNIIAGLINGIKQGFSAVWNFISSGVSTMIGLLKQLDFGTVVATIMSSGIIAVLWKLAGALEGLAAPFEGVGKMLEGVGKVVTEGANRVLKSFSKVLKAYALSIKAKALKDIAIAIAILAGSIAVLALLPADKVESAMKTVLIVAVTLAAIVAALSFVFSKTGSMTKGIGETVAGLANIAKISGLILSVSIGLLMLAGMVKMISGVEWGDLGKALAAITMFGLLVAGLVWSSKLAGNRINTVGGMILKISLAMLLLVGVCKAIAGLDENALTKGSVGIIALSGLIVGLVAATNLAGRGVYKAGGMLLQISFAMLVLTMVAKTIARMEWSDMGKAAVGLAGLTLVIMGLITVTKTAGTGVAKVGGTLLAISSAMLILSFVAKTLAGMTWPEMGKAVAGIAGLGIIIAGLIAACRLASDRDLKRIGTTLLTMSISLALLAVVSAMLSVVDTKGLLKGIVAVGLLSTFIALMTVATRGANDVKGNLMMITIAVGVMTAAAIALTYIDPKKLAVSIAAMSAMMLSFAAMTQSVGRLKAVKMGPLITMVAVIALLTGVVILLSKLDAQAALKTTASLSILLVAFSASMLLMSGASYMASGAMIGLAAMLGVVVVLSAVLAAMSFIPDTTKLVPIATSLTILLGAMSAAMVVLSLVGPIAGAAIGPALLMGLVVAELAVVLGLLATKIGDVSSLMPTAKALSLLLIALSAACILLIPVGLTGPAALLGALSLIAIVTLLGGLAVVMGEVMSRIPQEKIDTWKEGITKFMDLLAVLATGLGRAIGAFIGGIAMGALENVGTGLSNFMANAKGFLDGVRTVDNEVLKGAGMLSAAILALSVADFVNGVYSLGEHGSSLATLGTNLSNFMTNAQGFLDGVKGVSPEVLTGVKNLASAILMLTAADLIDGITSLFGSDTSLADFGEEIVALGPSLQEFSDSVTNIDNEAIVSASEAAKTLAEMAKAMPNSGGLMGKIFGENDMDTFGTQLQAFGAALQTYSDEVSEGIDIKAIKTSVEAGTALAAMAEEIPNFGGIMAGLFGDNDLVTFGQQLISFGRALVGYSTIVSSDDAVNIKAIKTSVEAGTALAAMAEEIPNFGGVISGLFGDNDLTTFAEQISAFGTALVNYSSTVSSLTIEPITNSVEAAKGLVQLSEVMPTDGGFWSWIRDDSMTLSEFGNQLLPFAIDLVNYSNTASSINTSAIHTSVNAARAIVSFINSIADLDTSGVGSFVSTLTTLGSASVDTFVSAFTNSVGRLNTVGTEMTSAISDGIHSGLPGMLARTNAVLESVKAKITSESEMFKSAGSTLMSMFSVGIINKRMTVVSAVTSSLKGSIESIKSNYTGFHNAGKYLVEGFAAGISANTFKAKAKAEAMARAALRAAEETLAIASPSKKFFKIGDYAGQGFVNALVDYGEKAYAASSDMAENANLGVSDAISKIRDIVAGNMDVNPTIRPVLDLSEVQNGANQLNGFFAHQSLALAGANVRLMGGNYNNLAAIASGMQGSKPNNSDVVTAISELRGDFGSLVNAIGSMQIRMDSGTVVGELIGKIDTGLGRITTHRGRGN